MEYNTNWEYIETCSVEECERVMRQALADDSLEESDLREIMYMYGRQREWLKHDCSLEYTPELAQQTIAMNDHLSAKCMEAGRVMMDLMRNARRRGLEEERLYLSIDVVVSAQQPWDADELDNAMLAPFMAHNLVCKTFYNKRDDKEYTDRNTVLSLSDDDDSWDEALPREWCKGMRLTMPFDRVRDGVMAGFKHLTQIRNYDIVIDETYDL